MHLWKHSFVRLSGSIRWKLAALVAVVVMVPTLILSVVIYWGARDILRNQIHERLTVVASDRQRWMLAYVQQQLERAALVSSRTRLRQLLEQYVHQQLSLAEFRQQSRSILIDAAGSSAGIADILVLNLDGRVICATNEHRQDESLATHADFQSGRTPPGMGLPHDNGTFHQACVTGLITTNDNQILGIVMLELDVTPMMEALSDRTGLGNSGEVILGALEGDQVKYLLPTRHSPGHLLLSQSNVPAMTRAIQGRVGFDAVRDYRDQLVLAAYRPINYRDWGLVAKMDVAEAYAPVNRLRTLLWLVEAGILTLGVAAAYVLARRYSQPIVELSRSAARVAAGELGVRVDVRSNDEIGLLRTAFNDMTERLATSYATLEQSAREN